MREQRATAGKTARRAILIGVLFLSGCTWVTFEHPLPAAPLDERSLGIWVRAEQGVRGTLEAYVDLSDDDLHPPETLLITVIEKSEYGYKSWVMAANQGRLLGCPNDDEEACRWHYLNYKIGLPFEDRDLCDMDQYFFLAYQIEDDELRVLPVEIPRINSTLEEGRLAGRKSFCPITSEEDPAEYYVVTAESEALSAFIIKHFDDIYDPVDVLTFTLEQKFEPYVEDATN